MGGDGSKQAVEGPQQAFPTRGGEQAGETATPESGGLLPEFVAGLIPEVFQKKKKDGEKPPMDRKTASEQAYDWVVAPQDQYDPKNKRSRGQLGPEEQGDFAKPYQSWAEAIAAEAFLRTTLLPAVLAKFGVEVHQLWAAYLNRSPGDSLEPKVFEKKSRVAEEFRRCYETQAEQNRILQNVESTLRGDWDARVATLPMNTWVSVPLAELGGIDPTLQTNFSNPDNIPGHIAGGVGSSDAGPDTRSVSGAVRMCRTADDKVVLEPDLHFVCKDAIDFIPGNVGNRMESNFTIPLSRLEASGWAYDVPFEVRYPGPVQRFEVKRAGDNYTTSRFEEADRNDVMRGNPGMIPDQQTPGAKQGQGQQQREEYKTKFKDGVTGKNREEKKQDGG